MRIQFLSEEIYEIRRKTNSQVFDSRITYNEPVDSGQIESINKPRLFSILSISSLVEGILTIIWITSIPADPKNAVLFGFSIRRLILLGMILLGLIILLATWILFFRRAIGQISDFRLDE